MRNYQRSIFEARDAVDADKFSEEAQGWLGVVNGGLQQENNPYESFAKTNLDTGINYDFLYDTKIDGSLQQGQGQVLPTQSYFRVQSEATGPWQRPAFLNDTPLNSGPNGTSTLLLEPLASFASTNGIWMARVINLNNFINKGTFMRIPTIEGMLHVEGMIDIEFLYPSRTVSQGNTKEPVGADFRFHTYIFVDGKIVATSGRMTAGKREGIHMAASIPINSKENTEIYLAFYAEFGKEQADVNYRYDPFTINIFNCDLWARNQYR